MSESKQRRIAVVLFNLGGPDRPDAVRPFLFNLFNDPAIIGLPGLLRTFVAYMIARRRAPVAQGIYGLIGGRSPILENTQAQATALETLLNDGGDTYRCFINMRYWHPMSDEAAGAVKEWDADEVALLPLYPQFSTTTTASSVKEWHAAAARAGLSLPTKTLCCYPDDSGFITAMAEQVRAAWEAATAYGKPRVLFSAHGLPKKVILRGDPYQGQCEATARAIVHTLGIDGLDWVNCYQSRVGPLEWIGPSTDAELHRAGADKVPVVIAPIAFVSEHSETLVEIDIEYRHLAEKLGVPYFGRVATVGSHPTFIEGLAGLVRTVMADDRRLRSGCGTRVCPADRSGCPNGQLISG